MFRGGLVETWGRGTTKIIDECLKWGLPEPLFEEKQGGVWLTIYADRYQEEILRKDGLNERQIKAVLFVRQKEQITNAIYQESGLSYKNRFSQIQPFSVRIQHSKFNFEYV